MDNKKIIEALKMQPLSEEEKAARHILGRLYGPIASCKKTTRNGRLYSKELWEKALKDEIFNEKVATKALFLELGHPADREETDMTKVCACIPEVPQIIGDYLYAYVDILDTANGRVLKTLCDYGFVPGISSRGSGDVMPNNEVDPETFFLSTWDIVDMPANEDARLTRVFHESLGSRKNIKLRKALVESLNRANEEDKAIMKETLDNLDIDIADVEDTTSAIDDIEIVITNKPSMIDAEAFAGNPSATLTEDTEEEATKEVSEETEEVEIEEAENAEETSDETEEADSEEADSEEIEAGEETPESEMTVGDFLAALQDVDADKTITIGSVEIDGKTYETDLEFEIQDEGVIVNVSCVPSETEVEEESNDEIEDEETEEPVEETESEKNTEDETEEAVDDGDDEVVESMKELVRQKGALEEEVKTLKKTLASTKSVGDAKVKELSEQLEKYKTSFARVSTVASKNKKANAELQEQLTEKDKKITRLSEANTRLSEQLDAHDNKEIKRLQENLSSMQKENAETTNALKEELTKTKKIASDNAKAARAYKAKLSEAVNKYISYRASMLGVKPSDITRQLKEGYTFDDIDEACENLLTDFAGMSRLPISSGKITTRINEGIQSKKTTKVTSEWGYDIDDDLLELAGLKKI